MQGDKRDRYESRGGRGAGWGGRGGGEENGETVRDRESHGGPQGPGGSYAETLRAPKPKTQPLPCRPGHALIVSSCTETDTSENVIGKVREALDARRLKETEDQLKNTDGLKFEPAASRDPRVVIRNVFSYNSEKDIVESLKVQNKRLWLDIETHIRPIEPDVDYRCLEDMLPETVARLQLPAHLIYTDGSKSVDGVGAAYSYWRDGTEIRTKRMRLESMCTVFQAELLAIARATDLVVRGGFGCAAVLSDSRSSLDLIRNSETHHPLATHIRKNIRELEGRGKILQFFWVKAHVGIPGNERADELARLAAAQSRVAPAYDRCPVSYVKRRIREGAVHRWNESFVNRRWTKIGSQGLKGSNDVYEAKFQHIEERYLAIKRDLNRKLNSTAHLEQATPKLEVPAFSDF
ncbi:hypothetical protein HW555_010498 [Spodoptera exigua]|uniref:RNase H type-1 domain-containing protein n=1 Tax=Spodoptera exigua TaxID=7107 RepID=A0A835GAC1_SPOEX|nr:hypothetical protein HW555_010498 [Spodoptera exigua]